MSSNHKDYAILAGDQLQATSGTGKFLGYIGSYSGIPNNMPGTIYTGSTINNALITVSSYYSTYMDALPHYTNSLSDITDESFVPGVIELSATGTIVIGNTSSNKIVLNGDGYYYFKIPNASLETNPEYGNIFIELTNGAKASKVHWYISGTLTLASLNNNFTNFCGTIVSQGNITLEENSKNLGSVISVNGDVILNGNNEIIATTIREPRDVSTDNYLNIESTLPDNEAITIKASSDYGGILMASGFGGIDVSTTNSMSINAAAASNFTTSNGDLILEATAGLVNIDAGSGINIGNETMTNPINIGTQNNKTINIGNNNDEGTTSVNIRSASNGNIAISSQSTNNDALQVYSVGGIDIDAASGDINIASGSNAGSAIVLDASYNGGGITLSSGSQGIIISSNGGLIGVGTFSGGNIEIGTAPISRTITIGNESDGTSVIIKSGLQGITLSSSDDGLISIGASYENNIIIGNTSGSTSVVINSGSGGLVVGGDTSRIYVGHNNNDAKTIIIGNVNNGTRIFQRFGQGGLIKHQEPPFDFFDSDSDQELNVYQILRSIITINPTTNITLTLPNAVDAISDISDVQNNDSIDFSIINLGNYDITLSSGTGGNIVGNIIINPGSSLFRMRFVDIISKSYTVYRIS